MNLGRMSQDRCCRRNSFANGKNRFKEGLGLPREISLPHQSRTSSRSPEGQGSPLFTRWGLSLSPLLLLTV